MQEFHTVNKIGVTLSLHDNSLQAKMFEIALSVLTQYHFYIWLCALLTQDKPSEELLSWKWSDNTLGSVSFSSTGKATMKRSLILFLFHCPRYHLDAEMRKNDVEGWFMSKCKIYYIFFVRFFFFTEKHTCIVLCSR